MNVADTITGVGLGLRASFAQELLRCRPTSVAWLEVHPENYVERGGAWSRRLDEAQETWRVVPHGLSLGLANEHPDRIWLGKLASWIQQIRAPWYSDHLCLCEFGGGHAHDLLPFPRTKRALAHCIDRMRLLQDALGVPVAIENLSQYLQPSDEIPEAEFLAELLDRADGHMLLDLNNLVVTCGNLGGDPMQYLNTLPMERVVQLHVAGHRIEANGQRIDTHDHPSCPDTHALLAAVVHRWGPRPVLLERDGRYPPLQVLLDEVALLDGIVSHALAARTPPVVPHTITPPQDGPIPVRDIVLPADQDPLDAWRTAFGEALRLPLAPASARFSPYPGMVRARLRRALRDHLPRTTARIGVVAMNAAADAWLQTGLPDARRFWCVPLEAMRSLPIAAADAREVLQHEALRILLANAPDPVGPPSTDFGFLVAPAITAPWLRWVPRHDVTIAATADTLSPAPAAATLVIWRGNDGLVHEAWWPDWLADSLAVAIHQAAPLAETLERAWVRAGYTPSPALLTQAVVHLRPLVEDGVLRSTIAPEPSPTNAGSAGSWTPQPNSV